MSKVIIDDTHLTNIANAIREKTNSTSQMNVSQMSNGIQSIEQYSEYKKMYKGIVEGNIRRAIIPSGTTKVGQDCFRNRTSLTEVVFEEPCIVEQILTNAFVATKLTRFEFPSTVKLVGRGLFEACNSIATVIFKGKPTITQGTMLQSGSIQAVYVPWSEGEVSGAPWGATNATIIYNYTGE